MEQSPNTANLQTLKRSGNTKDELPMPKPPEDAEFSPPSGKPYFFVVLSKSHYGKRHQPAIPTEVSKELPSFTVPTKIVYRGKVWDLLYDGNPTKRSFGNEGFGKFVADNNLVIGAACVFELMEGSHTSSIVKFKVHVLKSNFPSELLEKAGGSNENNPITID